MTINKTMLQKYGKLHFRHKHLKLFCYWLWKFPGQWRGIIKFGITMILCFSCLLFCLISESAIELLFVQSDKVNTWVVLMAMILPPIILGPYCYFILPDEEQLERMCELMDSIVKKKAPVVHLLAMYWVLIFAIALIVYVLID